ncbi:hypothetical protein K469DRAFT_543859, partial [Zopfia rhizophila CBS 207.26]
KPIDDTYEERLVECNCSICERNGYVWIYPKVEQVVMEGEENLERYKFGSKIFAKTFCKTCGINITNVSEDLSEEEIAALSEELKHWYSLSQAICPMNLRVLHDFNIKDTKTQRLDGWGQNQPMYKNP